jgi:phenylacetate-CoA ligase
MDVDLLTRVLANRGTLARHDRWTSQMLAGHQAGALRALRSHAQELSPLYRDLHADAPLSTLPVLTKSSLVERFDEALTTRDLSLGRIEERLRALRESDGDPGRPLDGRWWAAATGGTTGLRAVFAWDRREWATVLASYARATQWAGVRAGLSRPVRTAIVSSLVPTHQSAVVGASLGPGPSRRSGSTPEPRSLKPALPWMGSGPACSSATRRCCGPSRRNSWPVGSASHRGP